MERDYEKLVLEPRGPAYVLSRTDSHGITTELVLSELNVMFLGRIDMAERLHAIEEEIARRAAPPKPRVGHGANGAGSLGRLSVRE
jgi:hypothetical protein